MEMTNIGLIPNSSYNDFVLGSNISNYMDRGHTKKLIMSLFLPMIHIIS